MSVLERAALQASPLADLHAIASEMRIDGYRRLRKAALIDTLLERAGEAVADAKDETEQEPADAASAEIAGTEPDVLVSSPEAAAVSAEDAVAAGTQDAAASRARGRHGRSRRRGQ